VVKGKSIVVALKVPPAEGKQEIVVKNMVAKKPRQGADALTVASALIAVHKI